MVILIGMLAALLVAAVPVLAQVQITASGVLERSTRESPDPTPRYAITDEESGTSYEIFDAGAGLETYVSERVTVSGTRAPGPGGSGSDSGRHSEVRTKVVPDTKSRTLQVEVRENVEPGSEIHTDTLRSYRELDLKYVHNVVDHAERYVDGHVHTNGLENFWSLLKRSLKDAYVSVEPYHLYRYLDRQAFRFNEREGQDADRFKKALGS